MCCNISSLFCCWCFSRGSTQKRSSLECYWLWHSTWDSSVPAWGIGPWRWSTCSYEELGCSFCTTFCCCFTDSHVHPVRPVCWRYWYIMHSRPHEGWRTRLLFLVQCGILLYIEVKLTCLLTFVVTLNAPCMSYSLVLSINQYWNWMVLFVRTCCEDPIHSLTATRRHIVVWSCPHYHGRKLIKNIGGGEAHSLHLPIPPFPRPLILPFFLSFPFPLLSSA